MTAAVALESAPVTRVGRVGCRVCGSTQMLSYLNLGQQPHANALQRLDEPFAPTAPLRVFACQVCKLSQLSHVASRDTLYTTYAYRSGVSAGWRTHCTALAATYGGPSKMTLDIASNDGTMVNAMKATGAEAMGVEPSPSFADCNYNRVTRWWSSVLVAELKLTGRAEVITAQNVLGHVHDVHDFMAGVKLALASDGIAIIEVPYVGDLLRTLAFDTVYHEHLSYWSVTALRDLCNVHDLMLTDVLKLSIHGGSIRVTIRHSAPRIVSSHVAQYLALEKRDLTKSAYLRFSERVTGRIAKINDELHHAQPYAGFGAAAKTAVMLGCLDVQAYPRVVFDDNVYKHGYTIPGTRVPIAAPPTDWRDAPDRLCVFSWNWADIIIPRLRAEGYRGDIFVPMPTPYWDCL